MKSGDVVTVALSGDAGKPRPAVVLVAGSMADLTRRVVVIPMTTTIADASSLRVNLFPTPENGLRERSQLMIDRLTTVPREKIGATIGQVDRRALDETLHRVVAFLGP